MNPFVSIIVPIYNSENFLKKCLDSLINQTYSNLEIILVDDGSTDKSASICDEFASTNNKTKVIHTKNNGSSAARNCGISASTGDYITFIDSDDCVSFNYIEALLNNLIVNNSDAVMACEHGISIDKNFSIVEEKNYTNSTIVDYVDEKTFLLYCKSKGFCDTRKLFKRSLIDGISFDEDLGWGEDFIFMYKMACYHPHKMSTELNAIYYYTIQIDNPSINRWQNKKMNKILKKMNAICKDYKKKRLLTNNSEFVLFYESCFVSRYNYCVNKLLLIQLLELLPYRISYFCRNKNLKSFIYSFFPYIFKLILSIKCHAKGQKQ